MPAAKTISDENRNEYLVDENKKLLAENIALKKEISELKKKRKASSSTTTGKQPPAKKAAVTKNVKKLCEKWSKALVREVKKAKVDSWCGSILASVKETTPWSKEEYTHVFDNVGTVTQPTPDNKPTSILTIRRLYEDDIKKLFGSDFKLDGYMCSIYRKRAFQKSYKCGEASSTVHSLEVHYHRSKMSLELKFNLATDAADY